MESKKSKTKDFNDWRDKTLANIRSLIKQVDSTVIEELKWRKPSNSMRGIPAQP